jgi:hypothetical protein
MCSWVVTAPKTLQSIEPPVDEKQFFQEVYKFLINRYGGEKNVISAHVHYDETTPHMHFAFVPIIVKEARRGKNKGKLIETVCAHDAINKNDLVNFHYDLEKYLKGVFGREVGILNDATKDGNRSIEELKRGTAVEKLAEIEVKLNNLAAALREQIIERDKNDKALKAQEDKYNKTKADIETLNNDILKLSEKFENKNDELNRVHKHLESARFALKALETAKADKQAQLNLDLKALETAKANKQAELLNCEKLIQETVDDYYHLLEITDVPEEKILAIRDIIKTTLQSDLKGAKNELAIQNTVQIFDALLAQSERLQGHVALGRAEGHGDR